ncbi:hypothetical protein NLJ89_g8873 [Agrocybe chaxingu]|uniref:Fungal-type protein kinase domain-containing protein n=1 Tax=Agrocybe chaxingu TaxID=84603 RepID=A0A9W8MSD6_9AGAR|nr:hypothetical protein NLJ89_g8873 [Agrocybe chaxingu]
MATPWATCLGSKPDSQKISGNPEFMSRGLLQSIELNFKYLQSPVDDLFSIYWVALWAILNNVHTERSEDELWWRMKITKGYLHRSDASADICKLPLRQWKQLQQHSPILQQWSPVLKAWFQSLDRLEDDWRNTVDPSYDVKPGNSPGEYYLPHFHYFALRGVADFLEMIQPHYTQLRTYPPFV